MPIVLARIDDRLIHGQVTVGWTRSHNVNQIVVVNDAIAKDPVQSTVLSIAAPPGVDVSAMSVEQTIRDFKQGKFDKKRVMFIFTGPREPLQLVAAGVPLKSINVGGMKFTPERRQIAKSVSVSPEEESDFRELVSKGVEVELRMFPSDQKVQIQSLLSRQEG